jgi:predicted transcriptional regulator
MLVRDAMVPPSLVVQPTTTLAEYVGMVMSSNMTTAVVVDDDRLVGMVSMADVFRRILPAYVAMDERLVAVIHATYFEEAFAKLERTAVSEIMATAIDSLRPQDTVLRAVELFVRKKRKTLPVLDGERLVGVLTRRRVLELVTRQAKA